MRPALTKERKEVASRYYQLLSGHASIGSYLAEKTHTVQSSECWWCGSGERQSRYHLFFQCRRWAPESKKMWRDIGKACGWRHPRAHAVRHLFEDDRATPAVLTFIRTTRVGGMITLHDEGEEDKDEEIEMWPDGRAGTESEMEEEGGEVEEGEEGGPGPP